MEEARHHLHLQEWQERGSRNYTLVSGEVMEQITLGTLSKHMKDFLSLYQTARNGGGGVGVCKKEECRLPALAIATAITPADLRQKPCSKKSFI